MSRKEISKIPGFGSKSVQLIERLLGHPLPPDKPPPRLAYWLDRGIPIQGARALVNAGIETVEDLAGRSRDELRSIRFVGEVVISRLEEAVGTSFPDRSAYWLAKGLTPRLSNALVRLGLFREEDLRALTREQFLAMPGVAESGLRCCEAVLGQPLRGGR